MENMTIKEYATACKITVPAAHKRVKSFLKGEKKYPEIRKVQRFSNNFLVLKINGSKGFTNKCNNVAKIN